MFKTDLSWRPISNSYRGVLRNTNILASIFMAPRETQTHQQPPNGGVAAWMKTLGCFLIYMNTWGIATSFGVYQSYYQQHTLREYAPGTISWIGTVQVFLLFFIAIIAGPIYDRGQSQWLLYVGCTLTIFGYFMLSLAASLYQIILSQSVCVGIGKTFPKAEYCTVE